MSYKEKGLAVLGAGQTLAGLGAMFPAFRSLPRLRRKASCTWPNSWDTGNKQVLRNRSKKDVIKYVRSRNVYENKGTQDTMPE